MKDYTIDVVTAASDTATVYAAQAFGTLSSRKLFCERLRHASPHEAAITAAINCIKDLSGFLSAGDRVDIQVNSDFLAELVTKGSKNAALNTSFRGTVSELFRKGVDVMLVPAANTNRALQAKADMTLAM
jgi:hypothetical protein